MNAISKPSFVFAYKVTDSAGKDDVADRLSKDTILTLYRSMIQIREFELKAREIFRSGQMPGFIHVYVGEEAVATGVCAMLRENDYVASTHRGHGHALAKGIPPRSVMAELMGAADGCSGGRWWHHASLRSKGWFPRLERSCSSRHSDRCRGGLSAKLRGTDQVAADSTRFDLSKVGISPGGADNLVLLLTRRSIGRAKNSTV